MKAFTVNDLRPYTRAKMEKTVLEFVAAHPPPKKPDGTCGCGPACKPVANWLGKRRVCARCYGKVVGP